MDMKCSFCGKPCGDVRSMIAGPSVYICDACVVACHDIVQGKLDIHCARCELRGLRPGYDLECSCTDVWVAR